MDFLRPKWGPACDMSFFSPSTGTAAAATVAVSAAAAAAVSACHRSLSAFLYSASSFTLLASYSALDSHSLHSTLSALSYNLYPSPQQLLHSLFFDHPHHQSHQ